MSVELFRRCNETINIPLLLAKIDFRYVVCKLHRNSSARVARATTFTPPESMASSTNDLRKHACVRIIATCAINRPNRRESFADLGKILIKVIVQNKHSNSCNYSEFVYSIQAYVSTHCFYNKNKRKTINRRLYFFLIVCSKQ